MTDLPLKQRRQTVSREVFKRAIERGINDAGRRLSVKDREALREVGRTATEVASNFSTNPGCPLVQAGLVQIDEDDKLAGRPAAVLSPRLGDRPDEFYRVYDSIMISANDGAGYGVPDVYEIRDGDRRDD